jgi:hypothetical protein
LEGLSVSAPQAAGLPSFQRKLEPSVFMAWGRTDKALDARFREHDGVRQASIERTPSRSHPRLKELTDRW